VTKLHFSPFTFYLVDAHWLLVAVSAAMPFPNPSLSDIFVSIILSPAYQQLSKGHPFSAPCDSIFLQ
jgi:hypothetical protein